MVARSNRSTALSLCAFIAAAAAPAALAQQPQLWFSQRAYSRLQSSATLAWWQFSRPGDVYVLLADPVPGQTTLLGSAFDLAFSPSLLPIEAGLFATSQVARSLLVNPSTFPSGAQLFFQLASFDPAQGIGSLLVSNVDSIGAHDAPYALVFSFENMQLWPEPMTGSFDRGQQFRLQGLPAGARTVRPLPPPAWPFAFPYPFQPLDPGGSRFQMVLRAEDLGAAGPERLVGVRWRPLFGAVTAETFPQFELLAAHSEVVPDYRLDPLTNQPLAPDSGLDDQFAANPLPGAVPVTMCSGAYAIQPQQLLSSGYMPFPVQQAFDYDGSHSLLLETRCSPRPGLGEPVNLQTPFKMGFALQARPAATNYASAGEHGEPTPLPPLGATTGTGDVFLFDWELVFERTVSVAQSPWLLVAVAQPSFHAPVVCGFNPPGTTTTIEFRGRSAAGAAPTPWSTDPAVADGMPFLQYRVTMVPNAATGAVPWIDTLIVPVQ